MNKGIKRLIGLVMAFVMTFSLTACFANTPAGKDGDGLSQAQIPGSENSGGGSETNGGNTNAGGNDVVLSDNSFASRVCGNYIGEEYDGSGFVLSIYNVLGNLYAYAGNTESKDDTDVYSFWAVEIIPEDPADLFDENTDEIDVGTLQFSIMSNMSKYWGSPIPGSIKIEGDGITVSGPDGNPMGAYSSSLHLTKVDKELGLFESDYSDMIDIDNPADDDSLLGVWKQKNSDSPTFLIFEKKDEKNRFVLYRKEAGREVVFYGGEYAVDGSGNIDIAMEAIDNGAPSNIEAHYLINGDTLELTNNIDIVDLFADNDLQFVKATEKDCPLVSLYDPDDISAIKGGLSYGGRDIIPHFKATDDIENNGTHFVRVGNVVFFRYFTEDSLTENVYSPFAEFLDNESLREVGCVCYYDIKTGETGIAFNDYSIGELYYMDGEFYTERFDANDVYSVRVIQRCFPDGSGMEDYTYEEDYNWINCVSEDNSKLVLTNFQQGDTYVCDGTIYFNYFNSYQEEYLLGCDFVGDNVFAVFSEADDSICIKELNTSSYETIELGEIKEDKFDMYGYPTYMKTMENEGKVYIELAWFDGTQIGLQGVVVLEVTPEKENSLKVYYEGMPDNMYESSRPYFYFNYENDIFFEDVNSPEVRLTEKTFGNLVYFDTPYGGDIIKENMIPSYPFLEDEEGPVKVFEEAEAVNGMIFVITAYGTYSPEENYNWQMMYQFNGFEYWVFTRDGSGEYKEVLISPEEGQ